jgi:hypothetical protein
MDRTADADHSERTLQERHAQLTARLVAAQERMTEIGAQVHHLEGASVNEGNALTLYLLLLAYARAQREANAALAAARAWQHGVPPTHQNAASAVPAGHDAAALQDAATAATAATAAAEQTVGETAEHQAPEAPDPPSAHLQFVRWLYEHGRLSG